MAEEGYILRPRPPQWWKRVSTDRWLAIAAVLVAFAAAGFTGWYAWEAHRQADITEQARIDAKAASDAQARDVESSRKAAERSASAAEKSLIIGGQGADAAVHSAKTAESAIAMSRDQTRLSIRPWVGLTDEGNAVRTTPISFNSKGDASVGYSITTRNFSSNGAQDIMAVALLLITEDLEAVWAAQKQACGDNYVGKRDMGLVLFPGRERISQQSTGWYYQRLMVNRSDSGKFEGWLAGCIGYRDQFGFLYHTRFIYWLNDPKTGRVVEFDAIPNTTVEGIFMPWRTSLE